ncbi:MAG: hypothetical protein IK092_07535, partial [Muribaculaceae bacterium]|nr:hypothetical protein [Muribaculaceae bacterium]
MKITGVIFFVFAGLNLLIVPFAAAQGYGDAALQKLSAACLIGFVGFIFYYIGYNKDKEKKKNQNNGMYPPQYPKPNNFMSPPPSNPRNTPPPYYQRTPPPPYNQRP